MRRCGSGGGGRPDDVTGPREETEDFLANFARLEGRRGELTGSSASSTADGVMVGVD